MARDGNTIRAAVEFPMVVGGRYFLRSKIGEGGMGVVFRGFDQVRRCWCAIKFLAPEQVRNEADRRRFLRECQLLSHLRHPNIVSTTDFGIESDLPFLVLELCVDEDRKPFTLQHLRDASPLFRLPVAQLLELLPPMLDAVAYLHEQGLVHRDIKPENVLLRRGRRGRLTPKLSDFGLVALTGDEELRRQCQMSLGLSMQTMSEQGRARVGTYDYMSPEQRDGRVLDARSDVYSLGLIIYRLATGFERLNPELPSEISPEVPTWLDALVEKALQAEPAERWPSARAMFEALPPELIARQRRRQRWAGGLSFRGVLHGVRDRLRPGTTAAAAGQSAGAAAEAAPRPRRLALPAPGPQARLHRLVLAIVVLALMQGVVFFWTWGLPFVPRAIGLLGRESAPWLCHWLSSSRADVREAAAQALARLGTPGAEAVFERLRTDPALAGEPADRVLAKLGVAARPALISALGDPEPRVQQTAAEALVRQGVGALPDLVRLIETGDTLRAEPAAGVLVRLGPAGMPSLLKLLGSDSSLVRRQVIGALRSAAAPDVALQLGAQARAGPPRQQAAVVAALTELGAEGRRVLAEVLPVLSSEGRELALAVLRQEDARVGVAVADASRGAARPDAVASTVAAPGPRGLAEAPDTAAVASRQSTGQQTSPPPGEPEPRLLVDALADPRRQASAAAGLAALGPAAYAALEAGVTRGPLSTAGPAAVVLLQAGTAGRAILRRAVARRPAGAASIAEALSTAVAAEAAGELVAWLADPSAAVRATARQVLRISPRPPIAALTSLVRAGPAAPAAEAAALLTAVGPDGYTAIAALYQLDRADLAVAVVEALAGCSEDAFDGVVARLNQADYAGHWNAFAVVGRLPPERAAQLLLPGLSHPDPALRALASQRLSTLGRPAWPAVARTAARGGAVGEACGSILLQSGPAAVSVIVAAAQELSVAQRDRLVGLLAAMPAAAVPELLRAAGTGPAPGRDVASRAICVQGKAVEPQVLAAFRSGDPGQRAPAAAVLGELGVAAAVPELCQALRGGDDALAQAAARALGRLHCAEAIPELIRCLSRVTPSVRDAVREALVEFGAEAIPGLAGALELSPSIVRQVAVETLAQIGGPATVPALLAAAKDRVPGIRDRARDALIRPDSPPVLGALAEAARGSNQATADLAAGILSTVGEVAVPELAPLLAWADPALRQRAAAALVAMGRPGVAPLLAAVASPQHPGRGEVMQAATRFVPPAIEALAAELSAADAARRQAAADLLEALGPAAAFALVPVLVRGGPAASETAQRLLVRQGAGAVPVLVSSLRNGDASSRQRASACLLAVGQAGVPALAQAVGAEDPSWLQSVVGILRELGTSRVLPVLTEALAQEATAPQGRRGAALCLAQLGSDGIPVLVRSLGHTNVEVRRQARDALFTTGRACLDPVLREVERHNGRAPEAVAVLVRLRNDAVPGLERLMMSGTLEQCRVAATALAKIGTVEARRVLEAGAQEAYDSDRRKVIQKALERQRKTGR